MNSPNIVDQLDAAIDMVMVASESDLSTLDPTVSELAAIAADLRCMARPEFKENLKASLQAQANQMHSPTEDRQTSVLPTLFAGGYGGFPVQRGNLVASFLLHSAALALILSSGFWMVQHKQDLQPKVLTQLMDVSPYALPPAPDEAGGGGGGGDHDKLSAPKGNPPRFAKEQFTPPSVVLRNNNPQLAVDPTVVGPPALSFPQTAQMGNPLSSILNSPSNGAGFGGGIGEGSGGGVGSGKGPGVGPGYGGGFGGGVFRVGGGVSAPTAIYDPDPEYSDEARKAKYQGTVLLWVIVDANGRPRDIKVQRSLGMGLDEKAIEAVRSWRFSPAKKDGHPVAVQVNIEVRFQLY